MAKSTSIVSQLREALCGAADSIGKKKDGTIVVRRGYFYRNGMDADRFATAIKHALKKANIQLEVSNYGDHWAPFKGGATVANSSHFWVELV